MSTGTRPLAMAAILAVGLGAACTRDDRADARREADRTADAVTPSPTPYGTTAGTSADQNTITAGEVAANPTKYQGQRVAVRGDVSKFLGGNAFTLDEDRLTADEDLLVLSQSGVPGEDHKNEKVIVSGRVAMYDKAEFERDYDWFRPTPEVEAKYKTRPVIIADSIRTADGRDLTTGSALPAGSGETGHGNRPADSSRP